MRCLLEQQIPECLRKRKTYANTSTVTVYNHPLAPIPAQEAIPPYNEEKKKNGKRRATTI
jgi:hypothetical protein